MKKFITCLFISLVSVVALNAQDYVVEPANGSVVETLTDIFITWEGAQVIDVKTELMVGGIKAYMINGDNKVFVTDVFCGPAWGDYINLTMMNPTVDAGEYQIEIPDDMITVDGVAVAAFNLNYTIPGMPTSAATFDITADDKVSLNTVYITVSPCEELLINEGEEVEAPYLIKNEGFNSTRAAQYTITITGANTATLTADKEIANGHYTLHIPRGNFIIDGEINPLIMKDFVPAAVENVTNDAQCVDVYDIRGVKVLNNAIPDEVKGLDVGIYIVNGKKIVVRNNK
ncbi:MAG: hypothetical protein IKJ79_07170 [Bacteroidaceae bacterium]|nr:hypothetical protein [Bacteroidaceae bacterium]